MNTLTFLHTSDWQIGMTRWFLDGEAQARFDDARIRAISKLGEIAVKRSCAFITVAGDVFESNSLLPRTLGRTLEALKALPVPIYLLPGNHDPLTADSILNSELAELEAAEVYVIKDSTPIPVAPGYELVGAPLLSKRATTDLVADAVAGLTPGFTSRIVVGHGQVAGRGELKPDLIDLNNVERALEEGSVSYVALGDTHSTEQVGRSGAVWFSGSPEVTDFHDHSSAGGGENNSGNALVVTLEHGEVKVDPVRVGSWRFEALNFDLNSLEDVRAFISTLEDFEDKSQVAIKYSLRGTLDLPAMRLLENELARLEPVFASLKPRERLMDLVLQPAPEDLSQLGLSGYALDAMTELLDSPDPHADAAVRLMFRLAKGA